LISISCGRAVILENSNLNSFGTNKQLFARLDNKDEEKGNNRVIDNHDPSSVQPLYVWGLFPGGGKSLTERVKLILVGNNNKKDQVRAETDRECRQRDKYVQEMIIVQRFQNTGLSVRISI